MNIARITADGINFRPVTQIERELFKGSDKAFFINNGDITRSKGTSFSSNFHYFIAEGEDFSSQITDEMLCNLDLEFRNLPKFVKDALRARYNGLDGDESNIEFYSCSGIWKHGSVSFGMCAGTKYRLSKPTPVTIHIDGKKIELSKESEAELRKQLNI